MNVPLLDLKAQYKTIKAEILEATLEVYESQRFILGPKVEELEGKIADYTGVKYAVGVSSGTDALLVSLMAADIGKGDLVITTPYTFFATVGSIERIGAIPLLVDIDPRTYNIDTELLQEKVSSMNEEQLSRLKAIMPVHLFGQCANMEKIVEVANSLGIIIIEDAAQAIGSEYRFKNGSVKRAGSMSKFGCFSFSPLKISAHLGMEEWLLQMMRTPTKNIYNEGSWV